MAAGAALAVTFGAVRFLDLNAGDTVPVPAAAAAHHLSLPLAIPGGALVSSPLALPGAAPEPETADVHPQSDPQRDAIASLDRLAAPAAGDAAPEPAPSLLDAARFAAEAPSPAAPALAAAPVAPAEPASDIAPAELAADADEAEAAAQPADEGAQPRWIEHRVAKGESLARIFDRQGLDAGLLHRIVSSSKEAKSLANILPGQTLRFLFDENRELGRLELHRNRIESLRIAITDDAVTVEEVSKAVDTQVASTAGLIESSLFVDGQKAGLSDAKIMELATIFGWDIDFALEIRAGDQFRVLFEEHYLDGEKLRDGPILAAEFTNRGKTYRAVRYEDSSGEIGYFDDQGHSKRRAFIRTPIKFARISSRFNPKRWHPVLKRWRSHKGVDYAAPTGTPIKASGDGRVVFRGTKGGYGRTVILQHAGKYTTLYAHMSKYSKRSKVGTRVKQGQVIGYVGKTGLASGPHLHYEFRVNGAHKDPLRVKLPKSLALPKSEIAAFKETAQPLLARLDAMSAETMVASATAAGQP